MQPARPLDDLDVLEPSQTNIKMAASEALNSFLLLLRAAVERRHRPTSVRQISNYRQQLGVFAPHKELKKWGTASLSPNVSFGVAN